jgi:hypothetical protein
MRSLVAFTTLIAVGLVGCSSGSDSDESGGSGDSGGKQVTVAFELTGTGKVEKIRFNDVNTHQMSFVDPPTQLPWRKEITGPESDYLTLSAITIGDTPVTCKITIDGKEVATATDTAVPECKVG